MNARGPIAVAGATGYTGGLVAAELRRRGAEVVLVGRDATRLAAASRRLPGAEVRPVPGWDRRGLVTALRGCVAVVACAGPFTVAGPPVVEAAVDAGLPYTDSTGEQGFVRWMLEEADAAARSAGVALLPACGFDFLPGDLLAALAADGLGPLERLDVVYVAADPAATTPGTRRSVAVVLAGECLTRIGGRLVAERVGARRTRVATPWGTRVATSIPATEALLVPLHAEVETVVTYLALPGVLGGHELGARVVSGLVSLPGVAALARRLAERGPAEPGEGALAAAIACEVTAVARDQRRRRVRAEGRGAYAFTARALSGLALRLASGTVDLVGVLAPAQVVEPASFLAECGMEVLEVEAR